MGLPVPSPSRRMDTETIDQREERELAEALELSARMSNESGSSRQKVDAGADFPSELYPVQGQVRNHCYFTGRPARLSISTCGLFYSRLFSFRPTAHHLR